MLNPNGSQSNTQLQLPWEVSETTSQLLTLFRRTIKKFGSSSELFKGCLAWKAGTKCVILRLLFLCSSYLDFARAGGVRAVKIIGFIGSIMDDVHELFICWQLTFVSQLEAVKVPQVLCPPLSYSHLQTS